MRAVIRYSIQNQLSAVEVLAFALFCMDEAAMNLREIEPSLAVLLSGRPNQWAQVIAIRAALRVLPLSFVSADPIDSDAILGELMVPLRSLILAWGSLACPPVPLAEACQRAAQSADFYPISEDASNRNLQIFVRNSAILAASTVEDLDPVDHVKMAMAALDHAESAEAVSRYRRAGVDDRKSSVISATYLDMKYLEQRVPFDQAAVKLISEPLWLGSVDQDFATAWQYGRKDLLKINPEFQVWLDWYLSRLRGRPSGFEIPGDWNGVEDKAIFRRLAYTTDEDFWGKGHEYVNATLKGWLEDARARAAQNSEMIYAPDERLFTVATDEPETPPQETGAIAYGVNAEGRLDRLPLATQGRLSDLSDVRGDYAALRRAVIELLEEGEQRLGPKLGPKLLNLFASLPEDFERAQAAPLWRDGNTLRRLHRKHVAVAKKADWDTNRLDDVAAEGLGEVLDFFNNLCFSDGNLRKRDERRISPQEHENSEAEARAAAPLIKAVLLTPNITTPIVSADIAADVENGELPADDPFAAHVLDESNRTWRNRVAAILSWAKGKIPDPATVPGALAYGVAGNSLYDTAKLTIPAAASLSQIPLFEFIATNAAILLDYVAIAYPNHPHLAELIAQAKYLWQRLSGKV